MWVLRMRVRLHQKMATNFGKKGKQSNTCNRRIKLPKRPVSDMALQVHRPHNMTCCGFQSYIAGQGLLHKRVWYIGDLPVLQSGMVSSRHEGWAELRK